MTEGKDTGNIDGEVQAFLRERVESFEQLESLLFLHAHRHRAWTPREVAEKLNIPDATASAALAHLQRQSLVVSRGGSEAAGYEYSVENLSVAATIERLVSAHNTSRLEILRLMSSNAIERVRNEALHLFADAFVLGRKKDG